MSARSFARCTIFLRSSASAFLLSLSSAGGMGVNSASNAMSFASAKLTFTSCNSCSIPSSDRLDKSISNVFYGLHYRPFASKILRRSSRPAAKRRRPRRSRAFLSTACKQAFLGGGGALCTLVFSPEPLAKRPSQPRWPPIFARHPSGMPLQIS